MSFRNLWWVGFFFFLQHASQYRTLCRLAAFSSTFIFFCFLSICNPCDLGSDVNDDTEFLNRFCLL